MEEKVIEEFCKKQDEKIKQKRKQVEQEFGYLKEIYPKLLRQLKKSFDDYTIIKNENDNSSVNNKEQELNISLSNDLKTFFTHISTFEFEGIFIQFEDIYIDTFHNKDYLVLGEFWLYGDGDKLLYDIEKHSIHIFSHDENQVQRESKNMKDFVEKSIVEQLKEYEE